MKFTFSIIVLIISLSSFGANETNALFVTDDGHIFLEAGNKKWIKPQKIEEAKTNCESWSASDFPEGNWGELTNGLQLSLRFDQRAYSGNETIHAIVLVRNATNSPCCVYYSNEVSLGAINYLAFQESNQIVAAKPKYTGMQMPACPLLGISEGAQRKFIDRLNDTYDLTGGAYLIQASIKGYRVIGTNALSFFEAKSARVPIEIK